MLTPTRTLLWLLTVCLAGCSTARKTDVLEARLRSQEDMIAVYESEVERFKRELSSARRETEDLRLQLAEQGRPAAAAEETGAAFRAAGIQLSSLMTGGLDTDGEPGHDTLSVVLIPHDGDGELVKVPGRIEIEALDPTSPGGAQRIGHWEFDQRDVHEYWHKGVVQSGYQFQLPWQTAPGTDQVLVIAHLTTADGRRFDTNLSVKINPPGIATDGLPAGNLQQAAGPGVNPFSVRQAGHEEGNAPTSKTASDDVIWADGEGPAAGSIDPSLRQTRRTTSAGDGEVGQDAAASTPRRAPRPRTLLGSEGAAAMRDAAVRETAPSIEDWWSEEDRATREANDRPQGVRTSDSFTEQTLPLYR